MKLTKFIAIGGIVLTLGSCRNDENRLTLINSGSFPEKQITLSGSLTERLLKDSVSADTDENLQEQNPLTERIDQMNQVVKMLKKTRSDSTWLALSENWEEFKINHVDVNGFPVVELKSGTDSLANESSKAAWKWAELNANLLKLSGEIRFGDALEKMVYQEENPVLSESFLKSIIYTHIDDKIFINLIGSSSLNHHHTTGGDVLLIQETGFPEINEVTIKCESTDVRYLDVYIRIPSWAVNPTVTHGNVKYVAHPGEYCEIARKWNNGDEIKVVLMK